MIIGLLVLTVSIFSLPQINVNKTDTGNLEVELKLMKFTMGNNGEIIDFRIFETRRRDFIQIYQYGLDSFDIFDVSGEKIFPSHYEYSIDYNNEFLDVTYYFENNGIKNYRFYNNSYFQYEVTISGLTGNVAIPLISFQYGTRKIDNKLVSYIDQVFTGSKTEKFKAVMAIETSSEISDFQYYTEGITTATVYMGPLKKTFIREVFSDETNKDIDAMLKNLNAYSWTYYIVFWFTEFLWFLFKITGNFGWAIIIFTILIRLVLYPLYHKQTKTMLAMRKMQPEMDKIKKKYKDPQKQQEELAKLYKEHNVNPAGCLTSLIQLPVFIVLWQAIQYFGESFAYNPRFLFWNDLSDGGFSKNFLLILISLAAYMLNALLTSQNAKMAWQNIIMTLIFPIFLANLPSGVFLYYTVNALIQLVMTFFNNRKHDIKGLTLRELFGLGPKPVRR